MTNELFIDKDTNHEKKSKNNKKIIYILLAIILILIIVFGTIIILNNSYKEPIQIPDTNSDTNNIDDNNNNQIDNNTFLENYCEKSIDEIDFSQNKFAIASDTARTNSSISNQSEKSNYFFIYSQGKIIEIWKNNVVISENQAKNVIELLSQKGVTSIVIANPNILMVSNIKEKGMRCYNIQENINTLLQNPINIDSYFCNEIDLTEIKNGIIAIPSDTNSTSGVISQRDYMAKYFFIYENGIFKEIIENQENPTPNEIITILKNNNVNNFITTRAQNSIFKLLMTQENIKCNVKTGRIPEIFGK